MTFVGEEDSAFKGELSPEFTSFTYALLDETALELEARCTITGEQPKTRGKHRSNRMMPALSTPCSLNIIVYGPMELFDEIGDFCQERELYLHHPTGCKKNVPYRNPHWLSLDNDVSKFTSDLTEAFAKTVVIEDVDTRPELLDVLVSQHDLAEAEQPRSIRTILAR